MNDATARTPSVKFDIWSPIRSDEPDVVVEPDDDDRRGDPPDYDPSLTAMQIEGIEKIVAWYKSPFSPQVFSLFGFAGTGKTFLLRHIVRALGIPVDLVRYGAYTGKAAHVMRSKGIPDADTIHSLIYHVEERSQKHLISLEHELASIEEVIASGQALLSQHGRRDQLLAEIAAERKRLARPRFSLDHDSPLAQARLLVLDEVSMVDARIASDLLSFGVKLLVLGDPAQLPPIGGEGYFTAVTPDHLLTEVHRSALDSPVTRIATAVRAAPSGDQRLGVYGPDGDSGRFATWTPDTLLGHDVVLCWTNKLRWTTISQIRAMRGLGGAIPQMGDKIIVLANDREADVFNGQTFDVLGTVPPDPSVSDDILEIAVADDDGDTRMLDVWSHGFTGHEGEAVARDRAFRTRGRAVAATYAQAITVHKAQGSQWSSVLVLDQSPSIYGQKLRHASKAVPGNAASLAHAEARSWLYTATTRASERVTIVYPNGA